jgi:hypothetical protein
VLDFLLELTIGTFGDLVLDTLFRVGQNDKPKASQSKREIGLV